MFRTTRSPLGTLALLLLLAPSIAGCMSTQRIPFDNTARLDRITGVTTRSGREIPLFEPGASITNDTLYAVDRHGQLILPTDSIARVWNRKFSAVRTVGLVGGLALVGAAIAGFSAVGNIKFFPSQ
jgi:hypothetical protein